MRRLRILPSAKADLIEILDYVARESGSLGTGQRFVAALRAQCRRLAELPGTLGRPRPELRPDIRSFPFRGYVIFFRYVGMPWKWSTFSKGIETLTITFLTMLRDVVRADSPSPCAPADGTIAAAVSGRQRVKRTATEPGPASVRSCDSSRLANSVLMRLRKPFPGVEAKHDLNFGPPCAVTIRRIADAATWRLKCGNR